MIVGSSSWSMKLSFASRSGEGKRLGLIGYGRSESITCSSVLVHPLFYATSPWFVVDH